MPALNSLLSRLVDYAGLYPPANLPLVEVVRNYDQYKDSPHRWMLSRLIVPAERLQEFSEVYQQLFPAPRSIRKWHISSLIPAIGSDHGAFEQALDSIQQFNSSSQVAVVDAVEARAPKWEMIAPTLAAIGPSISAFLEFPWQNPDLCIGELGKISSADGGPKHGFAKIRTGGVTEDMIPPTDRVANFIHQCASHAVGFKATAGLHHPIRKKYALTYDANPPAGIMHGFLNMFFASCFAFSAAWSPDRIQQILDDTEADNFRFTQETIEWREHSIGVTDVDTIRSERAISFGSCSFVEAVDDLVSIGWLETPAKTV